MRFLTLDMDLEEFNMVMVLEQNNAQTQEHNKNEFFLIVETL